MSKRKETDEIEQLIGEFVAVYRQDKPSMLEILTVTTPLLAALQRHETVSDAALIALNQSARSLAIVSMCLAAIAKANPELAAMYQRLFGFLGYDQEKPDPLA